MNKVRNRQEIVEKEEEMYQMSHEGKLPIEYTIMVTDILDWCLGENHYLDTKDLEFRGDLMKDDSE